MSLTLAAVTDEASGRPLASVIRWCLVPGLDRSTGLGPVSSPPYADRTKLLSIRARDQSILSAYRSLLSKTLWILTQVPLACQSRSRRQQVIPHPQFISQGRSSQGMPVLSTKRMPVRTARSVTGGWPPLGLGVHLGSNGSMTSHSSSGSKGLAMIVTSRRKFPREGGAIIVPSSRSMRGTVRRSKYEGRAMRPVHRGMAITDAQFDALAGDLVVVLTTYNVPKEADELLAIVA